MADKKSHPKQSFEQLMHNAGTHRRTIAARAIENERRFRLEMERIARQRTHKNALAGSSVTCAAMPKPCTSPR